MIRTSVAILICTLLLPSLLSGQEKRIIGYFPSWGVYARDYHVPDIPADKITHLNFAFANVVDGECVVGDEWADTQLPYPGDVFDQPLAGSFHQLALLKEDYPDLKTLISVGGWTYSAEISDAVADADARETFAESCVDFMVEYGFDGIDLDWEYPISGGLSTNTASDDDDTNLTLFLEELRSQLDDLEDETGEEYLLTMAVGAAPSIIENYEVEEMIEYCDWINIMSYDFHGSWSDVTNFNSPLYDTEDGPDEFSEWNTDAAVQTYLDLGVPAEKLQFGVAFYGRGWSGVPDTDDGLYQEYVGLPTGTWEAGVFDYQDLVENYIDEYDRYYQEEASVPWLYNPDTEIMISYDDEESIAAKMAYVLEHDLGGVMFWELSGDDDDDTLLTAISDGLRGADFMRGDVDGNGTVGALVDALSLLNWAFGDGGEIECEDAADVDDNGDVSALVDSLSLLLWAFSDGETPASPGPEECGSDPTEDEILCRVASSECT